MKKMTKVNEARMAHLKREIGFERAVYVYDTKEFLEVECRRGGDNCTYRVYGDNKSNFMVTER